MFCFHFSYKIRVAASPSISMSLTNPSVSNFNFMQLSQVPNKTISDKFILHIFADHKIFACCSPRRGMRLSEQRRELTPQYITISSSFTDVFLPSSLHNTSIRPAYHRTCCTRCRRLGMCQAAATTTASQWLQKR